MGSFAPSPFLQVYERGSFASILSGVSATNAQVGTAPPVGSIVYMISPSVERGQTPSEFTIMVTYAGAPTATVEVYGSADGLTFFPIDPSITNSGLWFLSGAKLRAITAAVTAYSGTPGTDTVSVGLLA